MLVAKHEEAGRSRRSRRAWQIAVLGISICCGYVFVAANVSSAGLDLRPAGGDISTLLADRSQRVENRQAQATDLQREIDELTNSASSTEIEELRRQVSELQPGSGFTSVVGPGVRVALTDAPKEVAPEGVDPNFLVVHQQDIQAFVNALWAGGAEAVTLQGRRLVSTTGIKCVGNTVVLDGVPYSPPYVIEAVGDPQALLNAMEESPEAQTYRTWAERYDLGHEITVVEEIDAPPYEGSLNFEHANVA